MIINNQFVKIRRYSSREMKLRFTHLLKLAVNNAVTIIYSQEESFLELLLICRMFLDNKIKVSLVLTYLPYQRMDHKTDNLVKYVAQTLNSLKLKQLLICEPHCNLKFFKNATRISFVNQIFKKIKSKIGFDEEKDYVIFTDKGSKEKYGHIGKNHIYFIKKRDKKTGLIKTHEMVGKIEPDRKALLVDDIISSGDTIMSCLELLPNIKIDIIVGHFEKNKYNLRVLSSDKVNKVYCSNSLTKKPRKNLVLIKAENLLGDVNL